MLGGKGEKIIVSVSEYFFDILRSQNVLPSKLRHAVHLKTLTLLNSEDLKPELEEVRDEDF